LNVTPISMIYTLSLHDALPILIKMKVVSKMIIEVMTDKNLIHQTKIARSPTRGMTTRATLNRITETKIARTIETKTAGIAKSLRSEEHTSELQSRENLVCRLLL